MMRSTHEAGCAVLVGGHKETSEGHRSGDQTAILAEAPGGHANRRRQYKKIVLGGGIHLLQK